MSAETPTTPTPAAPRRRRFKKLLGFGLAGIAVVAACFAARHYFWGADAASAQGRRVTQTGANADGQQKKLDVVAVVNGEKIHREMLAEHCLQRFGDEVLDSLVNKHLILDYCQRKGIHITKAEVDQEIERNAAHFGIPKDQWLDMLQERRGISAQQYTEDIILPMVALRKVAQERLKVTPQELQAAYETQLGPSVEIRMIVCFKEAKAKMVLAKAQADPEDFGKLAKEHSDDVPSARQEGIVLPVRKHLGDEKIERVAFAMKSGQVSDIIPVGEKGTQYVILKCERQVPDQYKQFPLTGEVRQRLEDAVREKKERAVAGQIFDLLSKDTKVTRVLGNPQLSQQHPGMAAYVGQRMIRMEQLAEECIRRHGVEVLEGTISRKILEQGCRAKGVRVSRQDIDHEVARAAKAMGIVDRKTGQPDIKTWLATVEKEQGLTYERYVTDVVWPTAALKNYVHKTSPGAVQVASEDLRKGFEANYGPRVKCKAIVLNNQRTADKVWALCREKGPNALHFGQMAVQYSVEPGSRYLQGDVPPIQKHGGRPLMEKHAFALKAGEMSGIIQIGDKFVILFCTGHTKPIEVKFEEVRQEIYDDLFEKKLRIEMAKAFDQLMDTARIENFLANTRQAPKRALPPPGGNAGVPQRTPRR